MPEAGNWFLLCFGITFGDRFNSAVLRAATVFTLSKRNISMSFQQGSGEEYPLKSSSLGAPDSTRKTSPGVPRLIWDTNLETRIKRQVQKRVMRGDQHPRNFYL